MRVALLCAATLCVLLSVSWAEIVGGPDPPSNLDKILSLPGIDLQSVGFDIYGGYVELGDFVNTQLFYWFVESQRDPTTDPLVLWLNGGPGCSSLFTLFQENGPFVIAEDDEKNLFLELNPTSWNQHASIIYVESPFGTGFSFSSTNGSSYETTDVITARQNLSFLQKWFERFPNFATQPFFIGGEGYGGHFVPQLADQIRLFNDRAGSGQQLINLKGFLIGNPNTDRDIDENSVYPFMFGHSFASLQAAQLMHKSCNGSITNATQSCQAAINRADSEIGKLDPVNVYGDCSDGDGGSGIYACVSTALLSQYLNMATVQLNIHASPSDWEVCSSLVEYDETVASVLDLYPALLAVYKGLIYSGDADAEVNSIGTQTWIASLGLPIRQTWRPWHYANQVAGYEVKYENLTFSTVRGAGHMVPADKPAQALQLFTSWLHSVL